MCDIGMHSIKCCVFVDNIIYEHKGSVYLVWLELFCHRKGSFCSIIWNQNSRYVYITMISDLCISLVTWLPTFKY